ncbi:50S ribosomal subunit protein L22 [Desulfovibrionales bacterium]
MEVKAAAKYMWLSAQKARLVGRNIHGLPVEKAMYILKFTPKKAAAMINKVLHSAVANASQISGLDVDRLKVKRVQIDVGPTKKRFMPRAMGRASKIIKRTCHITVIVEES